MRQTLLAILLLISICSFGQSESNVMVTYDTTILVTSDVAGGGGTHWLLKITRPAGMFTVGSPDTASRPAFFSMPGAGEVQTGAASDTNFLTAWGPHYWLKNGWDGGVLLGNGKHYPILITVVQPAQNTRPWYTESLVDTVLKYYHINRKAVHMMGLSQGAYEWGEFILYSKTTGDEHCMSEVQSYIDLEGVGPGDNFNGVSWAYPQGLGHWAKKYGGKLFGLEGTNDSRNIWQITENMNDSVGATQGPTAAGYFYYENIDGGAHGGWNQMYDPSVVNWTSPANANLVPSTNPASSLGNYYYNPTTGSNIFQWALRQGDTTLVGGSNPVVSGGTNQTVQLPTNSGTITGTATAQNGHTISTTVWSEVGGPNSATIASPSTLSTSVSNLIAGTYTFKLFATDNTGLSNQANVNVVVSALISPTVNTGAPQSIFLPTTSATITSTSGANGGATLVSVLWTFVGGPATPTIASPSSSITSVTGMTAPGVYTFKLTATDNNGNSTSATTTVTIFSGTVPTTTTPKVIVGPGEYQCFEIDANGILWGWGNKDNIGTGGSTTPPVAAKLLVSPVGLKFKYVVGGLHQGMAIDTALNVWTWGENDGGQGGVGTSGASLTTPVKITIDNLNHPFTNIAGIVCYYAGNSDAGNIAWKSANDTFWIWGATRGGIRGDGTLGSAITNRPVPIVMPGNRTIKQIVAGYQLIILCTDSTVWTTGGGDINGNAGNYQNLGYSPITPATDYRTLHQVLGITNAIEVAGGQSYNYALCNGPVKLYGWGFYGGYMGASSNDPRYATPTDLTANITAKLPAVIADIQTNSSSTYALLADSSLWAWGDNSEGTIGNGQQLNFATYTTEPAPSGGTPSPYAWDFGAYENPQAQPVHIMPTRKFVAQFHSSTFCYYTYAETADGTLYSWGRDKTGVLGRGVVECSSDQGQLYPDANNNPLPTVVNPIGVTVAIPQSAPLCKLTPSAQYCSECTATNGTISVSVGPGQVLSSTSSTLPGSATSTVGTITSYLWTQTSGPTGPVIDNPTSASTSVSNLGQGVYTFTLTARDNQLNVGSNVLLVNAVIVPPINIIIRSIRYKRRYKIVPSH